MTPISACFSTSFNPVISDDPKIPKSWRNLEGPLLTSVYGDSKYTRSEARHVSYIVVAIACFGIMSRAIRASINLQGVEPTFQSVSKAFHSFEGSAILAPISFEISTRSPAYSLKVSSNCFF